MARITYEDKVKVRNSNLPAKNTVRDVDLNEIKESVNSLYDTVDGVESDLTSKENTANKQDSLTVDGTGVKFPTVDAVNAALAAISTDITIGTTNINSGTASTLLRNEGGKVGDTDYTVPKTDGTNGQVLQTNGAGVVTWATISTGITIGTTAITSGTDGRVLFQSGGVVQQDSTLFWDNTNKRLGVGATPSSSVRLDVRAQGALSTDIAFRVRNSIDNLNIFQVNGNNTIYMLGDGDAGSIRLIRQTGHSSVLQHRSASTLPSIFTIGTTPSGGSIGQIVFDCQVGDGTYSTFTMHRFISGMTDLTGSSLQSSFGANNTACFTMKNSLNYQYYGSIPTTTPVDHFAMYSADIVAGNAAPHFRTENGSIIKLYQETTGVAAATLVGGGGTALTDTDTFDGYTLKQIVKALRNQGLLA